MNTEFKNYLLRPLDTVFFRSGQPFNAGDDHYIRSLFPPTPRTMQGIVRTRLLSQAGVDVENHTDIESTVGIGDALAPDLHLRGPYPFSGEPYFPVPRYLVHDPDLGYVQLKAIPNLFSDLGNGYQLPALPGGDHYDYIQAWLPWSGMYKLLWEGNTSLKYALEEENPLWIEEIRNGIKHDCMKGTTQKEHLYSMGHIRMQKGAEGLWFQCTRSLSSGPMSIGGEGRMAAFEDSIQPDMILPKEIAQAILSDKRFWVVLIQPARFEKNHLPDLTEDPWSSLNIRLITSVVEKPLPLGGFDLMKKRPADMCRYAPAGSSFLLELNGPIRSGTASILQQIHNTCCLGNKQERQMGFGHVMIGRVF